MHPDLEAIVATDEECRSRLTLAESRRERDGIAASTTRDASIEKRRAAAANAVEQELAAIRSEGDTHLAEMRERQKQYLATLAKSAEERFAEAVELYVAIVCRPEDR